MRGFLLASLALAGAMLVPPSAADAAACGERVLTDWRDGRIDGIYAIACYRDALANLPEDLLVYGTAQGDIQHALTRRLARLAAAQRAPRATATTPAATTAVAARPKPSVQKRSARRQAPTRSFAATKPRPPRQARRVAAPVSAREVAGAMTPAGKIAVIGAMTLVTAAVAVLSLRRLRRSR